MIGLTLVGRALASLDARTGQDPAAFGVDFVDAATREIVSSATPAPRFGEARAREILIPAFRDVIGREGTTNELQIAQGVSRGESYYGQAAYKNLETGERIAGTNNWTAQQCGSMKPPCVDPCFEATDTRANGTKYQACFRRFATPEEGAVGFLRVLYKDRPAVLAAASAGDVDLVAERMRASKYFELPLERYQGALNTNVDKVAKALGEPRATPAGFGGRSRLWPWAPIALLTGAIFYGTIKNRPRTRRRR